MLLFFSIIPILGSAKDETQLIAKLVPIIMIFQVLIIYIQMVNQYRQNKISKIGFLPKIGIYSTEDRYKMRLVSNQIIIGIKNSGTDAHNVSYGIMMDKKVVKSDVPLFLLGEGAEVELYRVLKKDFVMKQIDVRIKFEDMVKSTYLAIFRKDENEVSFKTLSTGMY